MSEALVSSAASSAPCLLAAGTGAASSALRGPFGASAAMCAMPCLLVARTGEAAQGEEGER